MKRWRFKAGGKNSKIIWLINGITGIWIQICLIPVPIFFSVYKCLVIFGFIILGVKQSFAEQFNKHLSIDIYLKTNRLEAKVSRLRDNTQSWGQKGLSKNVLNVMLYPSSISSYLAAFLILYSQDGCNMGNTANPRESDSGLTQRALPDNS